MMSGTSAERRESLLGKCYVKNAIDKVTQENCGKDNRVKYRTKRIEMYHPVR